jgi:hypothetical protein
MRLYIANPREQNQIVCTRLPEMSGVLSMDVAAGSQVMYGKEDLTAPQVEAAISQLRKYGLMGVDEVMSYRGTVPLIFSRDRPVAVGVIKAVFERNKGVKRQEGEDLRKRAAVGIDKRAAELANQSQGGALPPQAFTEITIQEEKSGTMQKEDAPVNVGLHVNHAMTPGMPPPRQQRRRRAA